MKTKHEKSFEQNALEVYAREQAIKQNQKLVNKIGLITGCISAVILLIAACYYLKLGALNIFSAFLLLMFLGFASTVIGFIGSTFGFAFVPDYRWNDT